MLGGRVEPAGDVLRPAVDELVARCPIGGRRRQIRRDVLDRSKRAEMLARRVEMPHPPGGPSRHPIGIRNAQTRTVDALERQRVSRLDLAFAEIAGGNIGLQRIVA